MSLEVDTTACLNDSVLVSIGHNGEREVVVENGVTTLSHPDCAFLPDGIPCGTYGCSYRSPVTFTDFTPGATITSANDIRYVRLNIEHSWIGDIYIGITCPNGQTASLMNYSNGGNSNCTNTIPSNARGWNNTGGTVSHGTYLGMAYDYGNSYDRCDSTASGNEPGVGWNYCWSSNTTQGYSYASGDGRIYRSNNAHNGRIDSSDVNAGTQFYHPDHNFSTLVGCPLNGQWYIEVMDGWSGDNGYVFDWELSLEPSLLPTDGIVTFREVLGHEVTTVNDSTFLVSAPDCATSDTTVPYIVRIATNRGDTIDTVFNVHYYEHYYTHIDDTLCAGDTAWIYGQPYTRDTSWNEELQSINGCDSTIIINLVFNPTYEIYDTLSFCSNRAYTYEGIDYGGPTSFVSPHLSAEGCDSIVHVTLLTIDSAFQLRMLMSEDSNLWSDDTVLLGCEPYTLYLRDTTPLEAWRQWYLGDGDTSDAASFSHIYDTGHYTLQLVAGSVNGCTDTVMLKDAVWVFPNPTADFDWYINPPAAHNPETQFINHSAPGGLTYLWQIPKLAGGTDLDTSTLFEPFYHWGEEGENMTGDYDVSLIAMWTHEIYTHDSAYIHVCADTAERTLTIVNDWLQFPNLVTPNGDGINDTWEVVNLVDNDLYSMNEIWIYNSWGILVFHGKDIRSHEDFWDPNQTDSPDGTYYYHFTGRCMYGVVKRNGLIEVLRNQQP